MMRYFDRSVLAHGVLVRRLAEVEHLGRIGLQRHRDRFQLVGGVGQPRQHGRARAARRRASAARHGASAACRASAAPAPAARYLGLRRARPPACVLNSGSPKPIICWRLAEPGGSRRKRAAAPPPKAPTSPHACAQATARRDSRRTASRVSALSSRRRGRQQPERQQAERAVGHHDQILGGLPARLDRLQQFSVELVGGRDVERRNVGDRRGLRLERLAQLANLLVVLARRSAHRRETRSARCLGTAQTKLPRRPK